MALDRHNEAIAPREFVRVYVLFGSVLYGTAAASGSLLTVIGGSWLLVVLGLAVGAVGVVGLTRVLRTRLRVFADRVEVRDGRAVAIIALGADVKCEAVQYRSPWTKGRVSPILWMLTIDGTEVPQTMSSKRAASKRARDLARYVEAARREP